MRFFSFSRAWISAALAVALLVVLAPAGGHGHHAEGEGGSHASHDCYYCYVVRTIGSSDDIPKLIPTFAAPAAPLPAVASQCRLPAPEGRELRTPRAPPALA